MESNDRLKLRNIGIKSCTCYYFDNKIKFEDFDLRNILIDKKTYENILVHNIWYKTLIGAKPLRIRFDKKDGFIRIHNRIRYLLLSTAEKYDLIYNKIRYLIGLKSGITYVISHNHAKIKVDS